MDFLQKTILYGNLAVAICYVLSYLIEKLTGLALLTKIFRRKQNEYVAHGSATIGAIFYIIINTITLLIMLFKMQVDKGFNLIYWICLVLLQAILFKIIHFKVTPIEPNKDNYDFSD